MTAEVANKYLSHMQIKKYSTCILNKKTSKIDYCFCLWSFQNQKITCELQGKEAWEGEEIKMAHSILSLHA